MPSLSPLLSYGLGPLFMVIGLCLVIAAWYFVVFFSTRKKPRTVLSLATKAPVPTLNIEALRAEYLQRVEMLSTSYANHGISARELHLQLSITLREFVAKVNNLPTDKMTLSDLRKMNLPTLTAVIETYYAPEFSAVEKGNVQTAVATAREVITQWS